MSAREDASRRYAEAEAAMTQAAADLREAGVYAASPARLRAENADYLGRLAAISRSGAEDAEEVLRLCSGDVTAGLSNTSSDDGFTVTSWGPGVQVRHLISGCGAVRAWPDDVPLSEMREWKRRHERECVTGSGRAESNVSSMKVFQGSYSIRMAATATSWMTEHAIHQAIAGSGLELDISAPEESSAEGREFRVTGDVLNRGRHAVARLTEDAGLRVVVGGLERWQALAIVAVLHPPFAE